MPTSTLILIWVGVILLAVGLDVAVISFLRWQRKRKPVRPAEPEYPAEAMRRVVFSPADEVETPLRRAWPMVRPAVPVLSLLALAALAVWPVVQDRWLGDRDLHFLGMGVWCRVPGLCASLYPPYILLVFGAGFIVVALAAWLNTPLLNAFQLDLVAARAAAPAPASSRRRRLGHALAAAAALGFGVSAVVALVQQRLPGWDWAALLLLFLAGWALADLPWPYLFAALRRHAGWLLAFALAHAALVAFIAHAYGDRQYPWLILGLLVAAGLNLLRYVRRVPPILWIVTLALVLFSLYLNAWWTSSIGDEYAFFFDARRIARFDGLALIGRQLFDRNGVYGTHPYFSSVLQAIPLALFGPTGAAWRLSSGYLAALGVGLFYVYLRLYASRRFALAAALLLAVSHYIMAFSKIGYNNLQALFALGLVLACAAWVVRTRLPVAYAATGLSLSFCFYVYPAAIYAIPVGLLVLLADVFPHTWADLRRWGLLGGAGLAGLFPLLLQPEYWLLKSQGTFLYNTTLAQSLPALAAHVASNFVYALGSFLYIPQEGHLVAASFVDPLTAGLVLLGLGLLLRAAPASRVARLWLLIFLVEVILVGATHDRKTPPTTRMFLLLPWLALLAAVGLRWLWQARATLGLGRWPARWLAVPLLAALLGLNLYQAYPLSRARSVSVQSLEAEIVRLTQLAQRSGATPPPTIIVITDPTWGIDGLKLIPEIYPVDAQFQQLTITEPRLTAETAAILADENAVIIIKPWLELGWQIELGPQIAAQGKTSCDVLATDGALRFRLWHGPRWNGLCAPPPPTSFWWWWQGL